MTAIRPAQAITGHWHDTGRPHEPILRWKRASRDLWEPDGHHTVAFANASMNDDSPFHLHTPAEISFAAAAAGRRVMFVGESS